MKTGYAFEITASDIFVVLSTAGIDRTYEQCEEILELLDASEVEDAALNGRDVEEQTAFAHEEILRQLAEEGVISSACDVEAPSLG